MIYFAFTSLSTVGFGDYYPVGDFERLYTSMILLAGVATFSYIMDNFMQIVNSIEAFNQELEDSDGLQKFYSMLRNFNLGQDLNREFVENMDRYFAYKWEFDNNQATTTEEDHEMLGQLPQDI